jgi:hypothetical protein
MLMLSKNLIAIMKIPPLPKWKFVASVSQQDFGSSIHKQEKDACLIT